MGRGRGDERVETARFTATGSDGSRVTIFEFTERALLDNPYGPSQRPVATAGWWTAAGEPVTDLGAGRRRVDGSDSVLTREGKARAPDPYAGPWS
jgi:hypothetical protein